MAALEQLEAAEANLIKLERLREEVSSLIPSDVSFGGNAEYEDRSQAYGQLIAALPAIGGWKPTAQPPDLDDIAQNRFDAMEVAEASAHVAVERWVEEPGLRAP